MGWQEIAKEKAKKAIDDYKFNAAIQQMKQSKLKRIYEEEYEKAQSKELRKKARADAAKRYAPSKAQAQGTDMFSVAFGSPSQNQKRKQPKDKQLGNVFNEVFGR